MVSNVLTGGGDPSSISLMEGQGNSSLYKDKKNGCTIRSQVFQI